MVKGQGYQAALVGCTGRPTWTYSNGDLSISIHHVYCVTTCQPGRGHIVAWRPPAYSLLCLYISCTCTLGVLSVFDTRLLPFISEPHCIQMSHRPPLLCPDPLGGALSDDAVCLTSICLSVCHVHRA